MTQYDPFKLDRDLTGLTAQAPLLGVLGGSSGYQIFSRIRSQLEFTPRLETTLSGPKFTLINHLLHQHVSIDVNKTIYCN